MRALHRLFARMVNFVTGRQTGARLREELESHIAFQIEENLRAGMPPAEARRRAFIKLGAAQAVREQYHSEGGLPLVETLLADTRFAFRQLRKSPGFTLVAMLTLALGIGANAAIFSLVNAFLLKTLPVTDPASLLRLGKSNNCCVGMGMAEDGEYSLFTTASYDFLRKNVPEFETLAAMQAGFPYRPVVVRRDGSNDTPRSVMGEFVSGNYFRTFGLTASAGRLLTDRDNVAGAPMTMVIGYEEWQAEFNGDPSIVGSTFRVNTLPVTVVGIAPKGFYGDRLTSNPPAFYLPIEAMPPIANVTYVHNSDMQWLYLIGRIRPGVSIPQLQQKVSALLRQQLATTPHYSSREQQARLARVHIVLTPGGGGIQTMQDGYKTSLYVLMWASGLVLLIACANIANFLLVRGMARKSEINMRTALGALRGRIVRQLLTESVLLSLLGGLAGLAFAYGGTRMLLAMAFPDAHHTPIHASPSPAVLAFAVGLSLLTGIVFGVAPAWLTSRAEPVEALRSGMRSAGGRPTMLQRVLVVGQAAVSLVLIVGAGLFAKSLGNLQHINLHLDPVNRYIVHINPQTAGYPQHQLADLYRTIEQRFQALPGVEKVGISSYTPMEDDNNGWSVRVQGKPDPHLNASYLKVNAGYFDSVGTRLVMGRGIRVTDTPGSTPVAVVNQAFVKKFFQPGENPIGQHFGGGPKTAGDWEIVGVVQDTAYQDATWADHRMYFTPLMQRVPSDTEPIDKDESLYAGAIVLETSRPVPDMEELARKTLASINPNLSVVRFQTFSAQIADQFNEPRMLSRLTMLFGVLALLLAALGLYGVAAYGVARRTQEIGIRMALGAQRSGVTALVMRGALVQTLAGLAIGIPAAILAARAIASQLYGIKGIDAGVLAAAAIILLATATLAGIVPAHRAATIDPARALRTE